MSLTQHAVGLPGSARARWSVYYHRKGKWRRKKFADDFGAALKFHNELIVGNTAKGTTLHCDNISFPPPNHIAKHERVEWEIVKKSVKGRMKRFKKKRIVIVNLMAEYNAKGIWWCPYCIKLRRFKEVQTDRGRELCCPVCWASQYLVREYNPLATIIEYHK